MRRTISCYPFLAVLLLSISVTAQHFEWAASASHVDLVYQYSSVDPDNNIVVGGYSSTNWSHREAPEVYDGNGNTVDVGWLQENNVIISFSPAGNINWHANFNANNQQLYGITHNQEGRTVLLCYFPATAMRPAGEPSALFQEYNAYGYIQAGYHLVYLNKHGIPLKTEPIFDSTHTDLEISSFQAYPGGGFVITGFADPGVFSNEIDIEIGPAGGDFVLKLDNSGKPQWADVVSYAKTTCCGYYTDMCRAAIAPDGTVYLGGTYMEGGTFGGKQSIVSQKLPDQGQYNKPFETYVASYSPTGKLNWVQTSGNRGHFHSIAANNEGVFLGFNPFKTDQVFGKQIDTTSGKRMALVNFDSKGKLHWLKTMGTDRSYDLKLDRENNLYVLGTHHVRTAFKDHSSIIGKDTLPKNHKVYIAKWSKGGEYQWVKTANIPITTINEPFRMQMDNCNNLYITGQLWFVLPAQMSWWDNAFIQGKGYGGAPLIARFNNTIPDEVLAKRADTVQVGDTLVPDVAAPTCVISPGPWNIRNYPNPFQTHTTLEYTLSYADDATLEIYSLQGQLIHTLFSEQPHEAGTFTITFNRSISPGTYVAAIRGTETIATCRMVVLR